MPNRPLRTSSLTLVPALAAAVAMLALGGCASRGKTSSAGGDGAVSSSTGTTTSPGSSTTPRGNTGPGSMTGPGSSSTTTTGSGGNSYSLDDRVVYFDYDVDQMRDDGTTITENFGRYLAAGSGRKLRLEGHTDERGSREYNLALSERRAQSVARALRSAGATDGQLSTTAYGEERPASPGSDEEAYAKNRRVELMLSE